MDGKVMKLFITGDTHADFGRLWRLSKEHNTTKEDIVIILGDSGINYMDGGVARITKENLSRLPLTVVCIHGNHERRPESMPSYHETDWHKGKVFIEDLYPSLIFLKDGELYDICGLSFFVIGGAYSPDKEYRLAHKFPWFSDEQPSDTIKNNVENRIGNGLLCVDYVLTHTCPYSYIPIDDLQEDSYGEIDYSTEEWLDTIEKKISYKKWFCGHYHINTVAEDLIFMFDSVIQLM